MIIYNQKAKLNKKVVCPVVKRS